MCGPYIPPHGKAGYRCHGVSLLLEETPLGSWRISSALTELSGGIGPVCTGPTPPCQLHCCGVIPHGAGPHWDWFIGPGPTCGAWFTWIPDGTRGERCNQSSLEIGSNLSRLPILQMTPGPPSGPGRDRSPCSRWRPETVRDVIPPTVELSTESPPCDTELAR